MKTGEPTAEELAAVATVTDLAECMERLRQSGGAPSLREMERWGVEHHKQIGKSSLGDALRGKRRPNPELLRNFLDALGVREEHVVRPWLTALAKVSAAQPSAPVPSHANPGRAPVDRKSFTETDQADEIYHLPGGVQEQAWLPGKTPSIGGDIEDWLDELGKGIQPVMAGAQAGLNANSNCRRSRYSPGVLIK